VLVGLPGAGKSTVAHLLAATWGCASLDTDEMIATDVGCDASEFLRREGEPAFRERELVALRAALGQDAVVSTGGGVVTTEQARALLKGEVTIWLDGDDEVLVERLADGDRPLIGNDPISDLRRLRAQRAAWYGDVARAKVSSNATPLEVAREVMDAAKVTP